LVGPRCPAGPSASVAERWKNTTRDAANLRVVLPYSVSHLAARARPLPVMAGLDPAIVTGGSARSRKDARVKPGHDERK
jgi:hypothetical protein